MTNRIAVGQHRYQNETEMLGVKCQLGLDSVLTRTAEGLTTTPDRDRVRQRPSEDDARSR
jgi:hypothetical protein